ncbi:hypothetical protein HN873_001977 [Arachis hypogaea]
MAQHTPSLVPPITLELAVPLNIGELNPSHSFSRRTAPDAVAGWSFEAHSVPHSANVSYSQQWKHSHRACLLPLSSSSVPPSQTLLLRRKLCSCLRRQFCSCLHHQLCSSRLQLCPLSPVVCSATAQPAPTPSWKTVTNSVSASAVGNIDAHRFCESRDWNGKNLSEIVLLDNRRCD